MSDKRIAILVDSGCDVPKEYLERYPFYMVPLKIIYRDGEYLDGITISPQEVYDRFEMEVPKTAQPSLEDMIRALKQIKEEGFTTVLCISISSGLSGTHNAMRLAAQEVDGLEIHFLDTLNIGIGAGVHAMYAAELLEQGLPLDEILEKVKDSIANTRIYYEVASLEYLAKGGRIGKVSAMLGSLLKIKPIITCNEEGQYVTATKARGHVAALATLIRLAIDEAKKWTRFRVIVAHGGAKEEGTRILEELKRRLPNAVDYILSQISPALGVHTGPGLIGVCVHPIHS
jgi:DegV family protein with EDD domain